MHLQDFINRRQKAAEIYLQQLNNCIELILPRQMSYSSHTYNQFTVRVQNGKRDQLRQYLSNSGIPTMIYYPLPLHLQEAYQYLGYKKGDFPVAEKMSEEVLSLPMHTELEKDQLYFICEKIKDYFNGK